MFMFSIRHASMMHNPILILTKKKHNENEPEVSSWRINVTFINTIYVLYLLYTFTYYMKYVAALKNKTQQEKQLKEM